MICYMLQCPDAHEFEVWFNKSADFETQAENGLIECPYCGQTQIEKAPMAPSIKRSKEVIPAAHKLAKLADEMRETIEKHCDDVGENFAKEARAIHDGEAKARGIYGEASSKEVKSLIEDGIDIAPLPPAIAPKRKKKLN